MNKIISIRLNTPDLIKAWEKIEKFEGTTKASSILRELILAEEYRIDNPDKL